MELSLDKETNQLFSDTEHYKIVSKNMLKVISPNSNQIKESNSYLFDSIDVEYQDVEIEKLKIDYINSKIIIIAPRHVNEGVEQTKVRTMYYHSQILPCLEKLKVNAITSIYSVLTDEGRKKISIP